MMRWHPIRNLGMGVLLALIVGGAIAQTGTEILLVKRPADLRDAPGDTARSMAPLAVQAQLTRLTARQGAWIQVRTTSGAVGWVHMFDVTTSSTQATGSNVATGALRGISNFFNRGSAQSATNTATSTIGIRGLGAEDIANAQPDLAALSQVDAMRQNAAQARKFGAEAPLSPRNVEPLPVPPDISATNTPGNPFKVP